MPNSVTSNVSAVNELRAADPFQNLDDDQLAALAARGTYCTATAGQIVCRQGERSDGLYVVITGRVAISRPDPEGHMVGVVKAPE